MPISGSAAGVALRARAGLESLRARREADAAQRLRATAGHAAASINASAASRAPSPDFLSQALPGGGAAISLLRQRAARPGDSDPLKGERFGHFMADVCKDVTRLAGRAGPGVPPAHAAEAMRMAVVNGRLGNDLTPADKGRMLYALYGVRQAAEAQQALVPLLAATPGFQSLPPEQAWRMLLDRSAWDDGRHAGLRFENEPGYMGAMYNGLSRVLQAHQRGRLLDAAMLEEVHAAATQGVYQMRVTLELQGEAAFQHAAELTRPAGAAASTPRAQGGPDRFEPGFGDLSTASFGLSAGINVTPAGLEEFFANQALHPEGQKCTMATQNERRELARLYSPSGWDGKCDLKLVAPILSREQNKAKADAIIAHYRQALPRAATPEAKLAEIAGCVQRLEQSHLFQDGNARTNGFLVLNKLLLENGFSPAMFADPNRFDANSTAELVQQIRQGQQAFADHCRTQP
jgi:hypothetical protein